MLSPTEAATSECRSERRWTGLPGACWAVAATLLIGSILVRPLVVSPQLVLAAGGEPIIREMGEEIAETKVADTPLKDTEAWMGPQHDVGLLVGGQQTEMRSAELQPRAPEQSFRTLAKEHYLVLYDTDGQVLEVWIWSVADRPGLPLRLALPPEQPTVWADGHSFETLLAALQGAPAEERADAVQALGESKDERAIEPMIGILEWDDDPDVRWRVVQALEDLGGERAFAAVVAAAAGDGDDRVRQRAVEALANMPTFDSVPPLTRVLKEDPDPFVRYEALASLGDIGGDRAMSTVRDALRDPDELIRAKAEEIVQLKVMLSR